VIFADGREVPCTNRGNFLGTQRTLDMNRGTPHFGLGLMSSTGVSVIRDDSLILNQDGEVTARTTDTVDNYVFAYGNNYRLCLRDFFRITGGVPLIPRFALGNWWSRYRAYTQDEYVALMERFKQEDIPLTVATIDMDWHWVDVNKKFGTEYPRDRFVMPSGWTGYSWNTDLFPDYKGFLKWLNDQNLKVTMNLHPAAGIRSFEDMYAPMAREMGIDPVTKTDIPFDMTDNRFINAYFKMVMRPYEDEGVRFWWIDWQQGTKSKLAGLDPLWALNHYHTLDNARNHRPLILSRYAGVGSHRYPLGFSGDSFILWRSLKLQPYFTNNATNIGYSWWSHDIGGHQFGVRSEDMYLRWLQYGVFSPVNRLHSTSNDLLGKEPWFYREDVHRYAADFMRLRHRMIPYLYTMNYLTYSEGRALCEPMYYAYPDDEGAYTIRNQYMFGTELMVCPITSPIDRRTGKAKVRAWLPKGRWTDIFTGQVYSGNKYLNLFRDESSIPVLAKEGAIIPFSEDEGNGSGNPKNLSLWVYRGNGSFTLYEDEGENNDYDEVNLKSVFTVSEGEKLIFTAEPAVGDASVLPEIRNLKIYFKDIVSGTVKVERDGVIAFTQEYDKLPVIELYDVKPEDKIVIIVENYNILVNAPASEAICMAVARCQGKNAVKMLKYAFMKRNFKQRDYKTAVKKSGLSRRVKEIIYENLDA
jgi:Alpha-glucosidases, family 31 of glycosyl hydrolases